MGKTWSGKKIGEVCEIYNGLNGKNKNHFENGNALYIPYKNIFNNMRPLQNLTPFSIILFFEHYWLTCSQYF